MRNQQRRVSKTSTVTSEQPILVVYNSLSSQFNELNITWRRTCPDLIPPDSLFEYNLNMTGDLSNFVRKMFKGMFMVFWVLQANLKFGFPIAHMKQAVHLEQQYQMAKYSNTACSSSQETPCCLSLCPADGSIIKIKATIKATEEVHQGHSLLCGGWHVFSLLQVQRVMLFHRYLNIPTLNQSHERAPLTTGQI